MLSALIEVVGTFALVFALIAVVLVAGAILNNRGITPPPHDLLRPGRRAQSPCPVDGSDQVEGGGHRIDLIDWLDGDLPRVHCVCGQISLPLSGVPACKQWIVAHRAVWATFDNAKEQA